MFALFLIALFTVIVAVTAGVLADCGLRWWSAFGALRRELKGDTSPRLPTLRPANGCTAAERAGATRAQRPRFSYAA